MLAIHFSLLSLHQPHQQSMKSSPFVIGSTFISTKQLFPLPVFVAPTQTVHLKMEQNLPVQIFVSFKIMYQNEKTTTR